MIRTWILIVTASAALLTTGGGCMGDRQTESGERAALQMPREGQVVVRSIVFEGNRKIKDKDLQKKLGFKVGDYLDEVLAELGRRSIEEHYRSKGYANVQCGLNEIKLTDGEVIYTVVEGERIRIKSVKFEGNKRIKTGALKNAIKTKTTRWLVLPAYYTEDKIEADIEKLRNVYYDRGFLNHEIRAEGQSNIVFHIEEGEVYSVRKVFFTGDEFFGPWKLNEGLELEVGEPYFKKRADQHVDRLTELYQAEGFIDAVVEQVPRFVLEEGKNEVDVEFRISQGEQFRIGIVEITGNEDTQDKVIRRILDEYDFTPGKSYNANLAPAMGGGYLEKRIRRMTLADEADIRPVDSNVPSDVNGIRYMDAQVNVKEGLTGLIMPGVGVSSDSGFIGRLIYQQRNFDISDWPESFSDLISMKSFRGGGQTLRIAAEPGTEVSQYSIEFTEPFLNDKPTSLDVTGWSYERYRESYDEGRMRGSFKLEKRLKNKWRPSIGFRGEVVDVDDLDTDAPQEIIDVKGNNMLYGLKVGLNRYLIDDEWNPSKGKVYGVEYEQVTGDHDFGILSANYGMYHTVSTDLADRKTVLATKLLGATVVGDAPPFEMFYAGGTGTYGIRGFEYRGVSTRGLQTNVANPERKDPIGSDWIFIAGSELSIPLVGDNFAWLIFADAGMIDTGPVRASVGTGIQIMIPQWFGPVPMRFSLAMPISKDDEDDTEIFSFSAGGLF